MNKSNEGMECDNKEYEFCLRCGRRLKNLTARKIGYGRVCEQKLKVGKSHKLFDENKKGVTQN